MKDLRVLAPADAEFANAALEAVRQWRFTQTRLDGVPMEVRMRVSVTFYTAQEGTVFRPSQTTATRTVVSNRTP